MKQKTHQNSVFQLAAQSTERIQKYIDQGHNSSFIKSIKSGSIPLINPDLHEFVDRTHDKNPLIYNKHYKTSKQRAEDALNEFQSGHLPPGPYRKLPMNMTNEILGHQKMPLRYGKNPRTENERLQQSLQNSSYLDHSQRDMNMAHRPNWKPLKKEKWVEQETFRAECGNFSSKVAWKPIPYRNPSDNYVFFEQDNPMTEFKRVRPESLEKQGKLPFNAVIKKNPYSSYSTSIRTFKQDQAFGIENKTMFSQNQRLKNYKTALISTKSMDHIIPYNHSNNIQAVKNLFPDADKQYLKSTVQLGGQLKEQNLSVNPDQFPKQPEFSQPSPIREYPQPDDFHNTNFEKTNYPTKQPRKPFKPYSEEEAKQIVDKYFHKQYQ